MAVTTASKVEYVRNVYFEHALYSDGRNVSHLYWYLASSLFKRVAEHGTLQGIENYSRELLIKLAVY